MTVINKPDKATLMRIEELLHEQLQELGEDLDKLPAHEIGKNMVCGVDAHGALTYAWKGMPILDVVPEKSPDGKVKWRFFTGQVAVH